MREQFVEHFDSRGVPVRVDRGAGIIHGVKILGLESKNGRIYRLAALDKSIPLYEGARVNVNHPQGAPTAPRGYEDRIGAMRNVRGRADGLYGDFHFNPKHRLAEQLLWDAENTPENVGFSHNVVARTSRQGGKTIVEEITQVQSVDLVADPATTNGLFEHDASASGEAVHNSQPRIWHNESQTWVPFSMSDGPTILSVGKPDHGSFSELHELIHTLETENEQLKEEVTILRAQKAAAQRHQAVEAAIAAAKLPDELVTEAFRQQCYSTESDAVLARLIEARQQDASLFRQNGRPRSIEQNRERIVDETIFDPARFAALIR